jgi:hydrogenase nickel incorporation protein HypA/HybF
MHEWALAEAVISTTLKIAAEKQLEKVTEINIKLGELQQVDREIFVFALSQLKLEKFQNVKFNIVENKAMLSCRVCGHEWLFSKANLDDPTKEAIHFIPEIAHTYIKCPSCGSPDFEIYQGRGIWIESIKGTERNG